MAESPAEETRPRRGKGRPMSAANAVGREALIKAACALLEQLPPSKVTRAEVARHAGVDPALIRYYFHDRASLLKAVVEEIVAQRMDPPLPAASAAIEDRVRHNIHSFFRFMVQHPFFHRLVIEELADADSDEARDIFRIINATSVDQHTALINEGVAAGIFKPVNPVLMHIAQIGLCEFFVAARPIIENSLGDDVDRAALARDYAELIGDMVIGGLKRA